MVLVVKYLDDLTQYIKITSDTIEKRINCELKALNVTSAQMRILIELHNRSEENVLMKDLEKVFNVTQATMQGIISRMEKKGYLSTEYLKSDKRVKYVVLTDEGRKLVKTALEKIRETQNMISSSLSDAEAEKFIKCMEKIYAAIK